MVAATLEAIEGLRRANQATAKLLRELAAMARPGVTTGELDDYATDYVRNPMAKARDLHSHEGVQART